MKQSHRMAVLTVFVIGIMFSAVMISTMNPKMIIETRGAKGWTTFALGEGNPGAGNGGVLEIYVYPHQGVPGTAYASNRTTASSYAWSDNLNSALTGNVPYGTTFDLLIKARANVSQAYNTSSSTWMTSWLRTLLTCANLGIGADASMTLVEIAHNAQYIWYNCYLNNGGAGYTITHGQNVNVTSVKLQAWY